MEIMKTKWTFLFDNLQFVPSVPPRRWDCQTVVSRTIWSLISVLVFANIPTGISITKLPLSIELKSLAGGSDFAIATTLLLLSRNTTSILKRIKKVWIELQGIIINPSPSFRTSLPRSPLKRLRVVLATPALSAKTVPLVLLVIFIVDNIPPCPTSEVGLWWDSLFKNQLLYLLQISLISYSIFYKFSI